MKYCPNCNAEVEDNFDMCWNCNYSFSEGKIIEFEEDTAKKKDINCLRCGETKMIYVREYKFHEGTQYGILGNLFEALENKESFDLYRCPKCGKVEFFIPEN